MMNAAKSMKSSRVKHQRLFQVVFLAQRLPTQKHLPEAAPQLGNIHLVRPIRRELEV
jgi:hypothetical protein